MQSNRTCRYSHQITGGCKNGAQGTHPISRFHVPLPNETMYRNFPPRTRTSKISCTTAFASISRSAVQVYHSGLSFCPSSSSLKRTYMTDMRSSLQVRRGLQGSWDANVSVLEGHSGHVSSVAYSPTGDRVMSASQDNTIPR